MNRSFYQDSNLGYKARGILGTLLSFPDGWETHTNHLIANSTDGRDSVLSGLRELESNGYFVRYAVISQETGKISHWVKEVFETPELAQEFIRENRLESTISKSPRNRVKPKVSTINGKPGKGSTKNGKSDKRGKSDKKDSTIVGKSIVGKPVKGKADYIYNKDKVTIDREINNSPSIISPAGGDGEREEEKPEAGKIPLGFQIPETQSKESGDVNKTELLQDSSFGIKDSTDLVTQQENPSNGSISNGSIIPAARENDSLNDKFVPLDPFYSRRRKINDIEWDWLPDGAWRTKEGKLDPEFQKAIAQRWVKEHGGDIHDKMRNVLKHFRNEPTNLPIEWDWYQSQFLHRVANIQTRKANGLDTTEDEQKIMKQIRAATPINDSQSVAESKDPITHIAETVDYALPYVHTETLQLPEGAENVSYAKVFRATDEEREFWECRSREQKRREIQSQKSDSQKEITPEQFAEMRRALEAIKTKKEQERGNPRGRDRGTPSPLSEVLNPQQAFESVLSDMQKYLHAGDELRQRAIDWACDPQNGCELVKNRFGKVIDIKEIDF